LFTLAFNLHFATLYQFTIFGPKGCDLIS